MTRTDAFQARKTKSSVGKQSSTYVGSKNGMRSRIIVHLDLNKLDNRLLRSGIRIDINTDYPLKYFNQPFGN